MLDDAGLTITDIRHAYGAQPVLRGISFKAHPGEILCLLGRSGCGKTTLLRMIAGLELPDAGVIALNGRTLTNPGVFIAPEERGVGFMFQDYALFPHLSILENAVFGAKHARATAMELLERVGLGPLMQRYPHTLSAGEQQRAALVRAITPRPDILLMDEPFSNLDTATRDSVRETTMALLRETGITAIIVTHDATEALRIADRIVLMEAGAIVQIDPPNTLYHRPQTLTAARYFSSLNEIPGICRKGSVTTRLGTFSAPTQNDGPVTVCIRPQDVHISDAGVRARVHSSSFVGAETILALDVEGVMLAASVRGTVALEPNQTVAINISESNIMFFALRQTQGAAHAA